MSILDLFTTCYYYKISPLFFKIKSQNLCVFPVLYLSEFSEIEISNLLRFGRKGSVILNSRSPGTVGQYSKIRILLRRDRHGRGDKKTKRGKINRGSFGKTRPAGRKLKVRWFPADREQAGGQQIRSRLHSPLRNRRPLTLPSKPENIICLSPQGRFARHLCGPLIFR